MLPTQLIQKTRNTQLLVITKISQDYLDHSRQPSRNALSRAQITKIVPILLSLRLQLSYNLKACYLLIRQKYSPC